MDNPTESNNITPVEHTEVASDRYYIATFTLTKTEGETTAAWRIEKLAPRDESTPDEAEEGAEEEEQEEDFAYACAWADSEHPFSADAIHHWFELSYAQYLTIPRSALQSMPDEWQSEFVALLEELDETIDWRPKDGRYWVQLKDKRGRYVADPLMDYERGRRRLEHKKG